VYSNGNKVLSHVIAGFSIREVLSGKASLVAELDLGRGKAKNQGE